MGKATPTAAQRAFVQNWRESNLSKTAFAAAHGLNPGTFVSWVARHRDLVEPPPVHAASFVRVAHGVSTAEPLSVRLADLRLAFDAPPPPSWFTAVLRELAC